jgi:hypothetical protein
MRIDEYPRPHNDSGIGFHYFPDSAHFGREDADRWIPRLQGLGASWLVVQTIPSRQVPDAFLQRLMMADIEPVVLIKPQWIGRVDQSSLCETLGALADSGVHYVGLYDRPNERSRWTPQDWARPSLVERFVDYLAPALEQVAIERMFPVLPPLEPFGAYWDTTFLRTMLSSLQRRGLGALLERAAVGMRNFANHRPLNWGQGGREAWPQARPYAAGDEGEDHRGFRLFEWYQEIVCDVLGHELPLIACANGPQWSRMDGRSLEPRAHAERAVEMARLALRGELPAAVMNHAFWVLAAERNQPGFEERWFDADGKERLPAVKGLASLRKGGSATKKSGARATARRVQSVPRPAKVHEVTEDGGGGEGTAGQSSDGYKPIDHYLLLPLFEWGTTRWHISIVADYVEAFLPTVGFSMDEARLAKRVTIVGNEQGVSARTAQALVAAGCQVERISGRTGPETQKMLQELARNKQQSGGRETLFT